MTDVMLVSIGATGGLRTADRELERSLRAAGVQTLLVEVPPPALARDGRVIKALPRDDWRWARAARRTVRSRVRARATIYSTVTAALLWPHPGAIRFDTTPRFNRPLHVGAWQRALERRRLREAPLLLPWTQAGLELSARPHAPAVVVPVPVEPSRGARAERDVSAVTYANLPHKKGLDRVLAAWARARRPGDRLLVAGTDRRVDAPGVEVVGTMAHDEFRALLRRTRVFVTAPRREDYGIVQLEALAEGCMLVTTPCPGPYVAYELAARLDRRLTGERLDAAIRTALDDPLPDYAERAARALRPFGRPAVDRLVAEQVVPRLLAAG